MQIEVGKPDAKELKFSLLLWGQPGCGKTVLASSAPGKKLFIMFDNNGDSVLLQSPFLDECQVAKMYKVEDNGIVKGGYNAANNPFGIDEAVKKGEIDTIVLDSLTSFDEKCLKYAVGEVKGASINQPGLQGYGIRNIAMGEAISSLLAYCSRNSKNLVVIAHESPPEKDDITGTMSTSLMLGGKLPTVLPSKFDEVWYLDQRGTDGRYLVIKSTRRVKPMRTRMFGDSVNEFKLNFDINTGKGGIRDFYDRWVAGNGAKVSPV